MNTKHKGDIAEQTAIVRLLKFGWSVSKPIGDNQSYDLIADVSGKLVKIQVKSAWYNKHDQNYCTDVRQTKTNRRVIKRAKYTLEDFDFALVFIEDLNIFYVFPIEVFMSFKSQLSLVETAKRQRKPKSNQYREAFDLISQWAAM